jgi:bifunctional non-homologous end joining protein LigD
MEHSSINLEYREGTSDKVYRAAIEPSGDGYVVNFAYGRRGSTMNTGTKTQRPVPYAEALDIYTKLVRSKIAKGYRAVGTGRVGPVVPNAGHEDTGLRPQLLNPVAEEEIDPYLRDSNWCAQEKFDGRRMLLVKGSGGAFAAANRRGRLVACPEAVRAAVAAVPGPFVIDGELVGEKYHAFDLLAAADNRRGAPYSERLAELESGFGTIDCAAFAVAPTVFGASAKKAFVEGLRAADKEGAVFKDLRACWSAGRPASGGPALKLKFWATCSCVVLRVNNRRSVELALSGHPVGNVTIPPNHSIPKVGQVVEIRYLYVNAPGGALYQPVYQGERDDIDPIDCTFEKQRLKCKPQEEDQDAMDLSVA